MKINKLVLGIFCAALLAGCGKGDNKSDAYGNFEATETIVSAGSTGKIMEFNVEEGKEIEQGAIVGYVDTLQLYLKKEQLRQQKDVSRTKFSGVSAQVRVLQQQKENAEVERQRFEKLVKDEAAPQKQLDDINANIKVLDDQIRQVLTQNNTTTEELQTYDVQAQQLDDQIKNSLITNPVSGTVLLKLSEPGEMVSFGKPLYKIADLSTMTLKVYVSGEQLPGIKIGDKVTVVIDEDKNNNRQMEGTVSWISSKAEFTPKIVQTKEERVNLVYAVKITVKNDGLLKIGMPGEVMFKK